MSGQPVTDDCEVVLGVRDLGTMLAIDTRDCYSNAIELFLEYPEAQKLVSMVQAKLDGRAAQRSD